jgi:hypothetical protein
MIEYWEELHILDYTFFMLRILINFQMSVGFANGKILNILNMKPFGSQIVIYRPYLKQPG